MSFNIPVVVIVFNRPKNARRLLEVIADIEPERLYVISDGARADKINDLKLITETRNIFNSLSWNCDVYKNYSASNLGVKKRITSGLNWVFEHEEMAIILEDDCIPNKDFFQFCKLMLLEYKNDNRIFSITGTNFFSDKITVVDSYFYSKYHSCWGWATWKRAWKLHDEELILYQDEVESLNYLKCYLNSRREANYWIRILRKLKEGKLNSWAYVWSLTAYRHSALQIVPRVNLVKNIGFEPNATHTTVKPNYIRNETYNLDNQITHPQSVAFHCENDQLRRDLVFSKTTFEKFKRILALVSYKIKGYRL